MCHASVLFISSQITSKIHVGCPTLFGRKHATSKINWHSLRGIFSLARWNAIFALCLLGNLFSVSSSRSSPPWAASSSLPHAVRYETQIESSKMGNDTVSRFARAWITREWQTVKGWPRNREFYCPWSGHPTLLAHFFYGKWTQSKLVAIFAIEKIVQIVLPSDFPVVKIPWKWKSLPVWRTEQK